MRQENRSAGVGRRHFLVGAGALVGSVGALGALRPTAAEAANGTAPPAPSPIPGGQPGIPGHPVLDFIHWFLPGPQGATTPILGLPAEGLDVEPSTITDYRGFTAYAVLSGEALGSDGKSYLVEFDIRVMKGEYIAEDGSRHRGAFGFF